MPQPKFHTTVPSHSIYIYVHICTYISIASFHPLLPNNPEEYFDIGDLSSWMIARVV